MQDPSAWVAGVRAATVTVTPLELANAVGQASAPLIVDVREREEVAQGIVATAHWIPRGQLESGIVALAILDVPLARADLHSALPKWTIHLVTHAETFGNGYGVALILLSLVVLESRKRTAARLALSAYGAGLAANVVKLCVERARPYYWLETSDPSLGSQFGGWFTLGGVGSHWQSFPSAHTATAVGLAYGLSKLYPCGRRWFTVLAAMVAVQRVVADMHYASDTLFAAAIALLFAAPLYGNGRLAKKFDAWEAASQASQVPLVETRRAA